ncbi:AsmA family protein [Candidatus Sumerlaeota bacterium]|nr:AsmA family protein [Candidatus Sumerlaeota bacterium]
MAVKKKIIKIVVILLIILFIAFGVGVAIIAGNMNGIARTAIVKVLSYVLQVDVKLEKVNISLLGGSLSMEKLVIGNPEGFKTSEAFSMDKIEVSLNIKSFRTDEPIVKLVNIENPRITLEQGFKTSNLRRLMKNASRFESGSQVENTPESQVAQKQIRIDKLIVSGAKVSLSAPVLKGEKLSVPVPRIELNDLGGKKEPITIAKSIKIFLNAVIEETLKSGGGVIPEDLTKDIKNSLSGAMDTAKENFIEKGSSEIKEGVEDAVEGIKGIFK